jgi:putative oxidoreductase
VIGVGGKATTPLAGVRGAVRAVQRSEDVRDSLLLVLRVVLAWIFMYHGAGKLFNYKDLGGIHGTSQYFQSIGLDPSRLLAYVSGVTEFFGGVLCLVGLGMPAVGFALVADMVVAMVSTNLGNGLIAEKAKGGFEINLALAGVAATVALLGAGRFSVDRLIGLASPPGEPAGQ